MAPGSLTGCVRPSARSPERLRSAFRCGLWGAAALMTLGGLVLFCFPKGVLGLFDASPELLELGVPAMRILVLGYACNGLSTLIATYLQAVGRVRDSMVINLTRQLALLVPMMWLLDALFGEPLCRLADLEQRMTGSGNAEIQAYGREVQSILLLLGAEPFAPAEGEPFDGRFCEKMNAQAPGLTVARCLQPGWRAEDHPLCRAVVDVKE